ncbi:MAG: lactonase family protein [Planctomycetota bacterium]
MRFVLLLAFAPAVAVASDIDVWIGTVTSADGPSRGVYHLSFDTETGKLSPASLAAEIENPGFLAKHPTLPVLYSTAGEDIAAWRIVGDDAAKRLEPINRQAIGDGGAAHVSVDRSGRVLLSAQYGGGSTASFPLDADGSIGERVSLIEHNNPSNVVLSRQRACHPHWTGVSPDNRFVLVPDLGADRVYVHRLDAQTATLARHGSVKTPPGGGPRHFKFHPAGRRGYVVNELAMSLSVFDWNADAGDLTLRQTIPTLSEEQIAGERFNSGSEVCVHPSGRFVYSANRGHDSITVFAVDEATGELTLVEQEPIRGSWPRNFNLDPTGRWLLVAGRDSNTLAVFAIDQATGELQYARETATVPAPICVVVE